MTQKPNPKSRTTAAKAAEEREARLRDLTEQCLELMDRLAEAGRERDQLRGRCAEMEDELARTQNDTVVSQERVAWLEEVLGHMHKTSGHIQARDLGNLKHQTLEAAEAAAAGDLEERFERLGKGIDLEHQLKAGLVNLVKGLSRELEAARSELEAARSELEATRSELEATRSELEAARGELEAARGELEAARREAEAACGEENAARAEAEAARAEVSALAAKADAADKEQARIRAEMQEELSSRDAAMSRLQEDATTVRDLRAILEAGDSESGRRLVERIRNLQAMLRDRDRWVTALLSELASRRLKLTRRGLMEHERKFLEDRDRAEGS